MAKRKQPIEKDNVILWLIFSGEMAGQEKATGKWFFESKKQARVYVADELKAREMFQTETGAKVLMY